jgi:phosphatidylglycerophosphate synthase
MARPLGALGFSPNSVTMLSVLSCLLYVYWASNGQWALALLGAGVSAVLDALDGALARLTKKTSAFGNYLDAYVDRIIEFFLVLPLIALAPIPAVFFLTGGFVVSYAKARAALVISLDNTDWPGFGERSERLAGLLMVILLLGAVPNWAMANIANLMWLLAAFTWAGALLRLNTAKAWIEKAEKEGMLLGHVQTDHIQNMPEKK